MFAFSPHLSLQLKPLTHSTPVSLKAGLYLVATPIGNLGDITLRALETLRHCSVIACEDTRTSRKLLSAYSIDKPLISYHDHSDAQERSQIIDRAREGQSIALISDAGTPLVSDPGYKLVNSFYDAGLPVTCIPGACSVITALVLSGLPPDRFFFAGFADRKTWPALVSLKATLVFLESARRVLATLQAMATVFANRQVAVVREMTKLFEERRLESFAALITHYETAGLPKGEIVLVLGPPAHKAIQESEIDALLVNALKTHSMRDACTLVAGALATSRKEVYQRGLLLHKTSKDS
jgi:16S rRNA (cytidine1402-2'-O)-methyltransferase